MLMESNHCYAVIARVMFMSDHIDFTDQWLMFNYCKSCIKNRNLNVFAEQTQRFPLCYWTECTDVCLNISLLIPFNLFQFPPLSYNILIAILSRHWCIHLQSFFKSHHSDFSMNQFLLMSKTTKSTWQRFFFPKVPNQLT